MSIVQKLCSDQCVRQYDAAGRLIEFQATPTPRELEAASYIEKLEDALRIISTGTPRVAAVAYRDDGKPSKFDLCHHGKRIYEDCDNCTSEYALSVLGEKI
jgi:hypothetical protein